MTKINVIITDPIGLHARPASILVQEANKFDSEITIEADGNTANLKSIMSVMAMGVKTGDEVIIGADGSDEKEATAALELVMKDNGLI
jgi:phosphocarrier protein